MKETANRSVHHKEIYPAMQRCPGWSPPRFFAQHPVSLHNTSVAAPPYATCGPSLLARRNYGHPEADEVAADRRAVHEAARRPAKPGGAIPTPAPNHPIRARGSPLGARHRDAGIVAIPIMTPLPNIPVHVVQTPCVGSLLTNGMCCYS